MWQQNITAMNFTLKYANRSNLSCQKSDCFLTFSKPFPSNASLGSSVSFNENLPLNDSDFFVYYTRQQLFCATMSRPAWLPRRCSPALPTLL